MYRFQKKRFGSQHPSPRSNSAFGNALRKGTTSEILRLLEAGQFDVNSIVRFNERNLTPLGAAIMAGRNDVLQLLLDHGAEIIPLGADYQEWNLFCGFFAAVNFYNPEAAELLVYQATDMPQLDDYCVKAISGAVRNYKLALRRNDRDKLDRCIALIRVFIDRGMTLRSIGDGERAYYLLCRAVIDNNLDAAKGLIKALRAHDLAKLQFPESRGCAIPVFAAVFDRPEIAELLFDKGVNPQVTFVESVKIGNPRVLALCLDRTANPQDRLNNGKYALEKACEWVQLESFKVLIEKGFRLPMLGDYITRATSSAKSSVDFIFDVWEFLLKHDGSVGSNPASEFSGLKACAEKPCNKRGSLLVLLLEHGADINVLKNFKQFDLQHQQQQQAKSKASSSSSAFDDMFDFYDYDDFCYFDYDDYKMHEIYHAYDNSDDDDEDEALGLDHYYKFIHYCKRVPSRCYVHNYLLKMRFIDEEYVAERSWIKFPPTVWDVEEPADNSEIKAKIEEFQEELNGMRQVQLSRSTSFAPGISLHEFMLVDPNIAARYSMNVNLRRMYEQYQEDFRKAFPNYGFLLNFQFRNGTQRRKLMRAAEDLLEFAIGERLTDEMGEGIFKFFSNKGLEKLVLN